MEYPHIAVEPHGRNIMPWRQSVRGGTAEDRRLDRIEVWLPPRIADVDLPMTSRLAAEMEEALGAVKVLDNEHGAHLTSLSTLLLRAESVASSKIEHEEASMDDFARALHGNRSNHSATMMVASAEALADLIDSVAEGRDVDLTRITRAHAILMSEDPTERPYAGKIRDMQNWIGGSDYSPRGALYVPPPPGSVAGYLDDMIRFANRTDLPVLLQAAVLHAQFESIHPFTDGNGRIGRALVNTVLRRRGATTRIVVPLASALVARRDDYFDHLGSYRHGDAGPLVGAFTRASHIAADESRVTSRRIVEMPQRWREAAGGPRTGSAAARIIETLPESPIFSAEEIEARVGGATSSIYAAIERLHDAEVIRPLTQRTKNQVWGASDLLDELDDLSMRIGARAREEM